MSEKSTKRKKNSLKTTKSKEVKKITKASKAISDPKNNTKVSKNKTATQIKAKRSTKVVSKKTNSNLRRKEFTEYYDLPFTYNQTFVKILAQTPNTLFVYWNISDADKKGFINKYGKDFFKTTRPILIIYNKTKNYSFEIEINDFANSWYFNINDSKCEYEIELGRRYYKIDNNVRNIPNYMQIAFSNKIESPNDHILFEKEQKTIFFKNTKTNTIYSKNIANLHFINHVTKSYRLFDFYNKIYKSEDMNNINNPTSNFTNI